MAMMNFISRGTQHFCPAFLQQQRGFTPRMTASITMISMTGAIAGGLAIGSLSDRRGRRRAMVTSILPALLLIPLWVLAPNLPLIALGACRGS